MCFGLSKAFKLFSFNEFQWMPNLVVEIRCFEKLEPAALFICSGWLVGPKHTHTQTLPALHIHSFILVKPHSVNIAFAFLFPRCVTRDGRLLFADPEKVNGSLEEQRHIQRVQTTDLGDGVRETLPLPLNGSRKIEETLGAKYSL